MRFFTATFATFVVLAVPILASSNILLPVETASGRTSGKYIVKFKEGASSTAWVKKLGLAKARDWTHFNGLASHLSPDALDTLRSSPDVQSISEDGTVTTFATSSQTNAPWGLQRISTVGKIGGTSTSTLNYTYSYDDSAGEGVDVYVVDTGIYVNHTQFGGRATWGYNVPDYGTVDDNGHGTHCSGTIAGSQYGVAKKASLIAVKVLDSDGSAYISDVIDGLSWVATKAPTTGRPSVVSMSLGGNANTALDSAVLALTTAGVHVAVAAGNSNTDAKNTSPARVPSAITVGASNITDYRASFSNYGPAVDLFAPGQNVISAWIGGTSATNNISGTSMAAPHIAGLIAYLIGKEGNVSPAAMEAKLKSYSVKGALSSIPSGTLNDLAHNTA